MKKNTNKDKGINRDVVHQQKVRLQSLSANFVEVGRVAGIKKQGVTNWFMAGRSGISQKAAILISEYWGVTVDWLLYGIEPMYRSDNNVKPIQDKVNGVPLISWVQAGEWSESLCGSQNELAEDFIPFPGNYSRYTFALKVVGESMFPDFIDGEIIFIDPEVEAKNGSCVVVKQNGDTEATFKQLVFDGSKKYLKALNPNWPNPIIEMLPDANIAGVVIGSFRKRL